MQLKSDTELNSLAIKINMFHSKELGDLERYNGWNFTSRFQWDDLNSDNFWYSKSSTQLFESERFVIGEQQLSQIQIQLEPSTLVHVDRINDGFLSYSDDVIRELIWMASTNINQDSRISLSPSFNSSDVLIQFSFDYVERVYTIKYFTLFDVMSKIGGFSASLMPIIRYLSPLLTLMFLNKLAKILRDKIKTDLKQKFVLFLAEAKVQFTGILLSINRGEIVGLSNITPVLTKVIGKITKVLE